MQRLKSFPEEALQSLQFFLMKLLASTLQFIKKYIFQQRCFPVNFAKFLRTPYFVEHVRWSASGNGCAIASN